MTETLLDQMQELPKVELHRHLEGSMRIETLLDIAHTHDRELANISLEDLRPHVQMVPGQAFTAEVFLSKFRTLRNFYNSSETIRRIAREVVIDAANENIKYLELRFTPKALCNVLACSYLEVMDWVCDTIDQTMKEYDIVVRLIVSMNRHEGVKTSEEVLDIALSYKDRGVVGIDLAGQEQGYPCEPFAPVFRKAKAAGFFTTSHAGEWMGADSVRETIEHLEVDRIGHGIRAAEDPELVNLLVQRKIVLEVCPTSNLHSGVVEDLVNHPLIDLYRSGVKTTINTDDPLISNINLTSELLDTMFNMKFTLADIQQQLLNGAQGAFLPAQDRTALTKRLENGFAAMTSKADSQ